jgi:hypothetical protein
MSTFWILEQNLYNKMRIIIRLSNINQSKHWIILIFYQSKIHLFCELYLLRTSKQTYLSSIALAFKQNPIILVNLVIVIYKV